MSARGVIRNRRFKQVNDFSGLRYGSITPTDIDGFLDFNDLWFVFLESKYAGSEMPYGQRLALERLVDCIPEPKKAIGLIAEHHHREDEDIDVARAMVTEVRYARSWRDERSRTLTVREAIDLFLKKWGADVYVSRSAEM